MGGRWPNGPMPNPEKRLSVVIVEDEALYRDLLRVALGTFGNIVVVGDFADAEAALAEIPPLQPDVAIVDVELPGPLNGVQLGVSLSNVNSRTWPSCSSPTTATRNTSPPCRGKCPQGGLIS